MKKAIAIILVSALLCLGALTGCSSNGAKESVASQTEQTQSSSSYSSQETHYNAPSRSSSQSSSYNTNDDYDYYVEDEEEYEDEDDTSYNSKTYVLNKNTKKFHEPYCSSVSEMKEKNKQVVTWSRSDIIAKGYSPCKRCNP